MLHHLWNTEVMPTIAMNITAIYSVIIHYVLLIWYYHWLSPIANTTCILSSLYSLLPGLTSINQVSVQYNPFFTTEPCSSFFCLHTLTHVLRCSGVSLHASTFTVIASQSITAWTWRKKFTELTLNCLNGHLYYISAQDLF